MVGFVSTFPDCCKIDCLCLECGFRNLPDFSNDWWCEGSCLCCFNFCGLKELAETQILCLGPCKKIEFKTTTSFPVSSFYSLTFFYSFNLSYSFSPISHLFL